MSYVSYLLVVQPIVMPHIRHMCVLLLFVMPDLGHVRLGLHIAVSLKGRTTCIWSFSYGFVYATTVGCAGFKLSFGIIIKQ